MKITIDREGCIECGSCADTCGEVFELKEGEKASIFLPLLPRRIYNYNENILLRLVRMDMPEFGDMGKLLVLAGIFLVIFGLIVVFWGKIPFIGNLPGDFSFQRGDISFFFPLVTSLIISLILTVILNLVLRFFK